MMVHFNRLLYYAHDFTFITRCSMHGARGALFLQPAFMLQVSKQAESAQRHTSHIKMKNKPVATFLITFHKSFFFFGLMMSPG